MTGPRIAAFGGVLMIAIVAVAGPLAHLDGQNVVAAAVNPLGLVFGLVGLAIALKRPDNPIGWILLAAGIFAAIDQTASLYAEAAYRHGHDLPLAPAAVLVQPSWAPAIVLYGVAVQLVPTGHLPAGRWRLFFWAYVAAGAVWAVGAFTVAVAVVTAGTIHVTSGGDLTLIDHPVGAARAWGLVQIIFFPVLGLSLLAWLVRELPRYRSATGDYRQQLKILIAGAVTSAVCGFVLIGFSGRHGVLAILVGVASVGLTALPVSLGIAVLKYRLYDIDRLVSRTLTYGLVTAGLIGVFLALVVVTTRVLPFSSPVGVAASTLAAAALFNPLRTRVQRVVDRRFNRARYSAERTVEALGLRLRDALDVEAVEDGLVDAIAAAFEPSSVAVWTRSTT
jgi:MFS family permease